MPGYLFLLLVTGALCCVTSTSAVRKQRLNVLFIMAGDRRATALSCYGANLRQAPAAIPAARANIETPGLPAQLRISFFGQSSDNHSSSVCSTHA